MASVLEPLSPEKYFFFDVGILFTSVKLALVDSLVADYDQSASMCASEQAYYVFSCRFPRANESSEADGRVGRSDRTGDCIYILCSADVLVLATTRYLPSRTHAISLLNSHTSFGWFLLAFESV